jgi:hypothetical protein
LIRPVDLGRACGFLEVQIQRSFASRQDLTFERRYCGSGAERTHQIAWKRAPYR